MGGPHNGCLHAETVKLATKIAAAISLVFALVLGSAAVAISLDELDFLEEEMDLHGRLLGHVVATAVAETVRARGEVAARDLVREIDEREHRVRIQWIDLERSPQRSALTAGALEQLRRGEVVGRLSPVDEDILYTYVPVTASDGHLDVIELAESLEARNAHVQSLLQRVIGGAVLGVVLSGVIAFFLGRRVVGRAVADLIAVARDVGAGNFARRADDDRSDELGVLAREMNEMARNLESAREREREQEKVRRAMEAQLHHADRLATVGQLASGVAHEIGTPLQAITIRADIIAKKASDLEDVPAYTAAIKKHSERVATLVRNLLRFARKQEPRRTRCDLGELVTRAVSLVETVKTESPVEIVRRTEDEAIADVDGEQIAQVVVNLVINALQSMPRGGRITVGVEPASATPPADVEQPAEEYWCLYVEDQGTGIPDEVLPHLFDPFFTTKKAGDGTGLGLSICYGIVRDHGGWIEVQTRHGEGTRFSVYLPTRTV